MATNRAYVISDGDIALAVPEMEDLEDVFLWINRMELSNFLELDGPRAAYPRLAEEKWLSEKLSAWTHYLVIRSISEGKTLWGIELINLRPYHRSWELSVNLFDPERLWKGIGTRAVRLMLRYAFEIQGLHSVSLWVRADNLRAIGCYGKCGFKEVARYRERMWTGDRYVDDVGMDVLRSEYEELK